VNLLGNIFAKGEDGWECTDSSGGGSGGGVLIDTGVFDGDGNISSIGGRGLTRGYDGGGGAGGRVAIYYESKSYSGGIVASGGVGRENGGEGTIYIQDGFSGLLQCAAQNINFSCSKYGEINLTSEFNQTYSINLTRVFDQVWNKSYVEWNDTGSIVVNYTVRGINESLNYSVYNNSERFDVLETDAAGTLPEFFVELGGSHLVSVVEGGNVAPNDVAPVLVSTDGLNVTTSDLNCSGVISDADGDELNVSVRWYKDSVLNMTIDYNNNYDNATMFWAVLDSGNTSKSEVWNCSIRIGDGADYSNWVNSSGVTILNSLATVSLTAPGDWSATTNRSPEFNWSGNDLDGDSIVNYEINISEYYIRWWWGYISSGFR